MCHHISNAVYVVESEVCLVHGGSPRYDAVTRVNAKQGVLPPTSLPWRGFRNQNRANFIFTIKKVHKSRREGTVVGDICIPEEFETQRSCQGRSLTGRFAHWAGQQLPRFRRVAAPQSSGSNSPTRRQYEPPKFYILLTVHLVTNSRK